MASPNYYADQIEIARLMDRVYDFALPPLILHGLYTGSAVALRAWLAISPRNAVTVLDTFAASADASAVIQTLLGSCISVCLWDESVGAGGMNHLLLAGERIGNGSGYDVAGVAVVSERARGRKCARSWKISEDVGADPEFPDITPRDAQAVREWQQLHGHA